MPESDRQASLSYICALAVLLLGLYLSALHSYLLFHTLIELATIAIAFTLFILTWNTIEFQQNHFLRILGIGYGFIALLDLLHAIVYKGMNVLPGYGPNPPTQLWIAARSLQAATLCLAPLCAKRRVDNRLLVVIYTAAVSALVLAIFSGNFPDCFVEGKGLTRFKIDAEYVITGFLVASMYLWYRKKDNFNASIHHLILASIGCTALSELAFTAYLSVYGPANMAGHFLKLAAFYLVYRAVLVTGFKDPFRLIFRELKETEAQLRRSHDVLEEKVRERTAELQAGQEKYRALIECANDAVFIHEVGEDGLPGRFLEVNELACRRLGYSREELSGLSPLEIDDPRYSDRIPQIMERLFAEGRALFETAQLTKDGRSIPVEVSTRLLELDGRRLLFSLVRDIAQRKSQEQALQRLNRELRAISDCNQVLMRAVDEDQLLRDICRIICDEAGYRMAWVGYAERDRKRSVRPVAFAGVEEGYLAQAGICWADTERGRGPAGTAIRSGATCQITDFQQDLRVLPWREAAAARGYRSSISLPLKDEKGTAFGALTIYSVEPDAFAAPEEIRLLEELAGDLAFGVNILRARKERKEAERNIALLSFALDNVREGAFLVDRAGRARYVNEEACRQLNFSREELLRLSVCDVDCDLRPEQWPAHWEEVKNRVSLTFEARHRAKGGEIVPVEVNANYLEYDGQGYILGLVRDIAERKATEEQRLAHLAFFKDLDEINLAIQGADDQEGMMAGVLGAALHIFRCDRAWLVHPCDPEASAWQVALERHGQGDAQAAAPGGEIPMTPELSGLCRAVLDAEDPVAFGPVGEEPPAAAAGYFTEPSQLAVAIRLKAGSPYLFALGSLDRSRKWGLEERRLFKEIARRVADGLSTLSTYRELQDSRAKLMEAQRIAHLGYWDRDVVANRIALSEEACRIFGLPHDRPVYSLDQWHDLWLALIHPEDRERTSRAYLDALSVGRYANEYRIVRPDGEIRHLHSEADVMRDEAGSPVRMLGMLQDVTARKQAEDALRRLTEELEQRVRERTAELEAKNEELARLNKLFVGRELRMVELKEKMRELENRGRLEEAG